jgi:hypothetical protein
MRRLAFALVISSCVLSACIEEHHGSGVVGTRDDMSTSSGDYTGYRVVAECPSTYADVGVIGTGSVALTVTDDISAAGQTLHNELADLASVWGWGGYGLVCEPGIGTNVWLSDWRDVDTVILRVGAWLRANDYALQVGIGVEGIPVPHAAE